MNMESGLDFRIISHF